MAHLIFIAKNRDLASYLLTGPALLGRSVECDVYVPDVFCSRQHCRFEKTPEGWVVIDQRSRNGIFYNGRRIYRRVLAHGDLIEIGSFSARFHEGNIPAALSTMTPFGEGTQVASLMDTLFSGGLRPGEYLRKSKTKPAWIRAREEAEAAEKRLQIEAEELTRLAAERLNFCDGCELDIELQIAQSAEPLLPQYVLISRELVAKFGDLLREGADAGANAGAGESIAAVDAMSSLPTTEGAGALSVAGAPAAAAADARAVGPRGPSGAVKGLWEQVYAEVESPAGATGKKDKKREREEAAQLKKAEKSEKKEKKPKKDRSYPDVKFRTPIGERFKDWFEWAKTVDVSIGGFLGVIRDNPKPFVIAASVLLIGFAGWGAKVAFVPKYHNPNLSHMSPEEIEKMRRAQWSG